MPVDTAAAEQFIHANARVLERHRLGVLLHGAPIEPTLTALRAYRNPDGGFGHALEPDIRAPHSEPASTLLALEILDAIGALPDAMAGGAQRFLEAIAGSDGSLPFVMPDAARYPHAPWMVPGEGGSFLTLGVCAVLATAAADGVAPGSAWLDRAMRWCWTRVEAPDDLAAYWVKYALMFLDAVRDEDRARSAIEQLRPRLEPDGSIAVLGGTDGERLRPLILSPCPGTRSRALFSDQQIQHDLDGLEAGQQDDGGWTVDYLAWSPGQAIEWRGIATLRALATLAAHGRLPAAMSS